MRPLLFALLCSLTPALATAQAPTAKPGASKPAAKKSARKPVPAKPAAEPDEPGEIDTDRMAVAPMVLRGESECEFKQKISLTEHPSLPGRFLLEYNGLKHVLTPQPTTTGVIRLEERRSGLVWLQVPIKSMLMDSRRGKRLADNCLHAAQVAEVESMKRQESAATQ